MLGWVGKSEGKEVRWRMGIWSGWECGALVRWHQGNYFISNKLYSNVILVVGEWYEYEPMRYRHRT